MMNIIGIAAIVIIVIAIVFSFSFSIEQVKSNILKKINKIDLSDIDAIRDLIISLYEFKEQERLIFPTTFFNKKINELKTRLKVLLETKEKK